LRPITYIMSTHAPQAQSPHCHPLVPSPRPLRRPVRPSWNQPSPPLEIACSPLPIVHASTGPFHVDPHDSMQSGSRETSNRPAWPAPPPIVARLVGPPVFESHGSRSPCPNRQSAPCVPQAAGETVHPWRGATGGVPDGLAQSFPHTDGAEPFQGRNCLTVRCYLTCRHADMAGAAATGRPSAPARSPPAP